jgi:hypothetical protein
MQSTLFAGLLVSADLQIHLNQADTNLKAAFLQSSDYLQFITYQDQLYIGKQMGDLLAVAELENVHLHLSSLLKRLLADYSYDPYSLVLISIIYT